MYTDQRKKVMPQAGQSIPGVLLESNLGEIACIGAEISSYFGLREKCESP